MSAFVGVCLMYIEEGRRTSRLLNIEIENAVFPLSCCPVM